MHVQQHLWRPGSGWETNWPAPWRGGEELVLVFGGTSALKSADWKKELHAHYPKAKLIGCSTAGEILGTDIHDDSVVATALRFEHTTTRIAVTRVTDASDSRKAGRLLAEELNSDELSHIFVLSDGLNVNGSDLVRGLKDRSPERVMLSGGLAADGEKFEHTVVCAEELVDENIVAAVGFYGDKLKVGCGSLGGWTSFGPDRIITKSEGNILYELDSQSALQLYKLYLGEHAKGLPATGLLFPLCIRSGPEDPGVVRTILGVDEESQSLIFAGDVPTNYYARLMSANFDRLIDGACAAASESLVSHNGSTPEVAVLVSCVGRRMVLQQRIDDEMEGVHDTLGKSTLLAGFYSYGEIAPRGDPPICALHNQTMTITTFSEA